MNGVQSALPLAAGGVGGFELGQAAGNIINHAASVPPEVAADVKLWVVALVMPVVAIAGHWLLNIDLNRDGRPDLAGTPTPAEGEGRKT